jgi:hypothetical protein
MMYIRNLAAIASLTLVAAGSLPGAAGLKGKTLPGAGGQTDHATDPVGRECCRRMGTERALSHPEARHGPTGGDVR